MRPNGDNDFSQRAPLALHARGPHHDPSANTTHFDHLDLRTKHKDDHASTNAGTYACTNARDYTSTVARTQRTG